VVKIDKNGKILLNENYGSSYTIEESAMEALSMGPCAQVMRVFSSSGLKLNKESPEDTIITKRCLGRKAAMLFVSIWREKIKVEPGMTLGQVFDQVCFFLDDKEDD